MSPAIFRARIFNSLDLVEVYVIITASVSSYVQQSLHVQTPIFRAFFLILYLYTLFIASFMIFPGFQDWRFSVPQWMFMCIGSALTGFNGFETKLIN